MKHNIRIGAGVVLLLVLAGCTAPIGVTKLAPQQAYEHLHRTALNYDGPSADALRVLNRYDLQTAFEERPDATLARLHAIAGTDDRRDVLYALAELNYLNASRISRSVKPGVARHAPESYFAAAIYAYLYLEGASQEGLPNPFDIRYRAAADFYNRGLALSLIVSTNARVELASGPRPTPPGVVAVRYTQPGMTVDPEMIKEFYSADEFMVRGLTTRNRDSGLGAPLVAVGRQQGNYQEPLRAPATVFLRVNGDVRDWSAGRLSATLELYSTFDARQVTVNGRIVPLQTDTTAPIALWLNNSTVWDLGLAQFFNGQRAAQTGLRRTQPYTPGRIPVVFVHGTASSPVWWAEMWNTLRADPVLRERCQYWAYNYASGNPITYTAGRLRNDLMKEIHTLDPDGKDPALEHMVIIGHSQGGLLAKLTAIDTGDQLWQIISKTNFDALTLDPKTRGLLYSNFFFKPLPCVSRVVFIATPHRGSYQNTRFVQRLLNRFIELPGEVLEASASLLTMGEAVKLPPEIRDDVPSSLSGMATDNPFMLKLAEIPVAPGIKANSIIAIRGNDLPPNGNDGVVTYTSAHVDYAESEFIVRDGHSCQGNPAAIEEVRRILLEDLRETGTFPTETR
jgi:pimeloyl-ACP methyl ester carboxylesterase